MGNPTLGRDRTPCTSSPITHDTPEARVMMVVEEVADMRGPGGQRKRIPHGNMAAKLPNYIGQIFECKADSPHYSTSPRIPPHVAVGSFIPQGHRKLAGWRAQGTRSATRATGETREGSRPEIRGFGTSNPEPRLLIAPFMQVSPVSLEQGIGWAAETSMNNEGYAPAFLDIAYPIT